MNELKLCPTPRTDDEVKRIYYSLSGIEFADANDMHDYEFGELKKFASALERELIATRAALKECGEALSDYAEALEIGQLAYNTSPAHWGFVVKGQKALSNPILRQIMSD